MSRFVLLPHIQQEIQKMGDHVELCDESGRLLGYYLSPEAHNRLRYQLANSLVSDDELAEARKHPAGRTTDEVIERLRKIEGTEK